MSDLIWGWAILAVFSAGIGIGTYYAVRRMPDGRLVWLATALVVTMLAVAFLVHDWTGLVVFFPFSNAVVLSNLLPLMLAAFAGVTARYSRIGAWRRGLLLFGIGAIAAFSMVHPVIRRVPPSRHAISDDVVIQTSPVSCSAAAVATLLKHHGIDATEKEMIDLCLTNGKGTSQLGLYRGLKLKTRGTSFRVVHVSGDAASLRGRNFPIVMSVCLPRGFDEDPRYENDWGWTPGQPHCVVLYGFAENDRVDIGDPSVGREQWTVRDLEVLWNGSGFFLEER